MKFWRLLFNSHGRIARADFWLALLIQAFYSYLIIYLQAYIALILVAISAGGFDAAGVSKLGIDLGVSSFDIKATALKLILFPLIPFTTVIVNVLLIELHISNLARDPSSIAISALAPVLVCSLPLFASLICVGIKRVHDRGKSRWWLLLFYGLPVLLTIGSTLAQFNAVLISYPFFLWALVELGFGRGTPGPNRYGLNPLDERV